MKTSAIAIALTWDGARWPTRSLPPKARGFLTRNPRSATIPSARKMADLFAGDQVSEIRVCWVPRLKGGDDVLAESFPVFWGKRIGFRAVKSLRFGDILGVTYRRRKG